VVGLPLLLLAGPQVGLVSALLKQTLACQSQCLSLPPSLSCRCLASPVLSSLFHATPDPYASMRNAQRLQRLPRVREQWERGTKAEGVLIDSDEPRLFTIHSKQPHRGAGRNRRVQVVRGSGRRTEGEGERMKCGICRMRTEGDGEEMRTEVEGEEMRCGICRLHSSNTPRLPSANSPRRNPTGSPNGLPRR
jgi:hypothetical protein